jgi:SAM-dependent methyltransferase
VGAGLIARIQRHEERPALPRSGTMHTSHGNYSRRTSIQAPDAASRRPDTIDRSVDWLSNHLNLRRGGRVLDLGCGPGLYAERLAGPGMSSPVGHFPHIAVICATPSPRARVADHLPRSGLSGTARSQLLQRGAADLLRLRRADGSRAMAPGPDLPRPSTRRCLRLRRAGARLADRGGARRNVEYP